MAFHDSVCDCHDYQPDFGETTSDKLPTSDWELTLIGAYGRDYQTADDAFAAWMANKDFYICTPGHPSYINKRDAEEYGVPNGLVRIRYKKKTEVFTATYDKKTGQWTKSMSTEEE